MTISYRLKINYNDIKGTILFGEADTPDEINETFRLRYKIYSEKGYIDIDKYKEEIEKDKLDDEGCCVYFIAKFNDRTIGSIRMIKQDVLPTEKYFIFQEPKEILNIPKDKRCEFGRFVIDALDRKNKKFLPRGLVMLFMFLTLNDYAINKGIIGGYSFVKESLINKMRKLKMPVKVLKGYVQNYPGGVLYRYFNQPNDKVIPIYFLASNFNEYIQNKINRRFIFTKMSSTDYDLNVNFLTRILFLFKII